MVAKVIKMYKSVMRFYYIQVHIQSGIIRCIECTYFPLMSSLDTFLKWSIMKGTHPIGHIAQQLNKKRKCEECEILLLLMTIAVKINKNYWYNKKATINSVSIAIHEDKQNSDTHIDMCPWGCLCRYIHKKIINRNETKVFIWK